MGGCAGVFMGGKGLCWIVGDWRGEGHCEIGMLLGCLRSASKDMLATQRLLMEGLIDDAGKFRTHSVGIAQGKQIVHLAPPAAGVPGLMKDLLGIDDQENHHRTRTFQDEFRAFLEKYGVEYNEAYVWD